MVTIIFLNSIKNKEILSVSQQYAKHVQTVFSTCLYCTIRVLLLHMSVTRVQ